MATAVINYAVPDSARYYTPARRFSRGRLLLALPLALILVAVAGVLYGMVSVAVKDIYWRVGSIVGAAVVFGMITVGLVHLSRVHDRAISILLGTLLGFVGLWASWVAWVRSILSHMGADVSLAQLAVHPDRLFKVIRAINTVGAWTFQGHLYRGGLLLIIWIGEAMILLLCCTFIAAHADKPGVFCPTCRRSCRRMTGLGRYDGGDTSNVRENVESGNFDYFLELGAVKHDDNPEIVLELNCCPCGMTNVLNVNRIAWEDNAQGRLVVKYRPIVERLLLSTDQVEIVKGLKSRLADLSREEQAEDPAVVVENDSPK